ncbi:hypothetical protein NIES4101_53520 [Calothrix sp. NIES-4101]|nr:hypothetical protein NIES4101_53520 [Calothrix sp. NIES-4101]
MRLIAPFARVRINDDIFETGDQTLLEVSVDLGEDARASKCSFSLYDPGLKIGGKYQAISFKVGGIEVPPDLLQSPQAAANPPLQVDAAGSTPTVANTGGLALPTAGSGGSILSRPSGRTKVAQADYYRKVWESMAIRPDRASMVQREGQTAVKNRSRYEQVQKATGVPWYVIAAIHFRECSYRFDQNIANGDPLTRRTTRVPAGRIPNVPPPYTFEQAAIDALQKDSRFSGTNWGDIIDVMWRLESYNGFGYLNKGRPSPYLLAGTQHYDSGMYVRDGVYSAGTKDPRIGVMAIIYYCLKAGGSTQTMAPVQQPTPQQAPPQTQQTVTPPVEVAAKGTEIIVELGFEPDQLTAYHFIHIGTDCDRGEADRTTFTGQSIRWLMTRRLENKSFENITLKQLAQEVCRKHNLKLEMEGNGPTYQFLDQTGITTYELLLRQCKSIGYTLKDKGDTLIIKPMRPEFTGYVLGYGDVISLKFSDKARSDRAPGAPSTSLSQPESPAAEATTEINRATGQTEQKKKDEKAGTGKNDGKPSATGAVSTPVTGNIKPKAASSQSQPPKVSEPIKKEEPTKTETSARKNANGTTTSITKTTKKTTEKGKVTTVFRTDSNTNGILTSRTVTTIETTKGTEITTEETNAAGAKTTKTTSNTKVTKAALDSLNLKPDEPTATATANPPTPTSSDALGLPKQPIGAIDLADGRAEAQAIADEAKRIRGYESSASVVTTPEILTLAPGSIIAISGELVPEPFDREWRVHSVSHKFPGGISEIGFYTPQAAANREAAPVAAATATTPTSTTPLVTGGSLAERIILTMQKLGHQVFTAAGELNIVYVEGIDANGNPNADRIDEWNDLRTVIAFEGGKPVIKGAWAATTEPGRYYTQNPLNSQGAFRIAFGQYRSWVVGSHRGNHEALVQAAPVRGYRDRNKDGERQGDPVTSGNFGINQHWGGDQGNVGRWSAGCLVGQTRAGHREFMAMIKKDSRYRSGYLFWTTVLDGKALA